MLVAGAEQRQRTLIQSSKSTKSLSSSQPAAMLEAGAEPAQAQDTTHALGLEGKLFHQGVCKPIGKLLICTVPTGQCFGSALGFNANAVLDLAFEPLQIKI